MNKIIHMLAFIFLFSGITVANDIDDFTEKKKACLEIFNDLKKSKGILEGRPPFLHVLPNLDSLNTDPNRKLKMAIAYPNGNIYLDIKTYEVCKQLMGDDWANGLSFILAHEIAHFVKQHNWRHEFVEEVNNENEVFVDAMHDVPAPLDLDKASVKEINDAYLRVAHKYKIRQNEAEADLEAGFMSYLAGYKTIKAGPDFLDKSYKVFEIDTSGGNYVSKADRKYIVEQTGKKLDTLISVFEAGNYATMIGEYDIALDCYDYVSKSYESKEIFNNMGIQGLMQVIDMIPIDSMPPYVLPITLDMDLVASGYTGSKGLGDDKEKAARELYQKQIGMISRSIAYFDKAMQLDEDYYIPALNKSVGLYLIHIIKTLNPKFATFPEDDLLFAKAAALRAYQKLERYGLEESEKISARIDIRNQLLIVSHMMKDEKDISKYIDQIESLSKEGSSDQMNVRFIKSGVSELKDSLGVMFKPENLCATGYDDAIEEAQDNGEDTDDVVDTRMEMLFKQGSSGGLPIHIQRSRTKPLEWNRLTLSSRNRITRELYFTQNTSKHYALFYIKEDRPNKDNIVKLAKEITLFATKGGYTGEAHCAKIGDDEKTLLDGYGKRPHKEVNVNNGKLRYYEGRVIEFKDKNGIIFQNGPDGKVQQFVITKSQSYF